MQLTIIKDKHQHQNKIADFANAAFNGSELTIFAKFNQEWLELNLDDVQPTNATVYKKHNFQISEDCFSYILIEHITSQVYRWTMIANNDKWKVGVFGSGLPPFSFGLKVLFNDLPKHLRAKFITDKLIQQ